MWSVWSEEDSVHIIPCDDEGYMLKMHEPDLTCFCHPEIIEVGEDGRDLVSHNMIQ